MTITFALVATGAMGAAIGQRLVEQDVVGFLREGHCD